MIDPIDPKQILQKTLCDVPSARKVIEYWPSAERMCERLAEFILDIMPDPYGEQASMLHRCLILGSSNWQKASDLSNSDLLRFKRFSDGLVKPLNELLDYRVVSYKDRWDPFRETLLEFMSAHTDVRVLALEYRSDERSIVNRRFLSMLMASRIISMDDVFAFQDLPTHNLLSFG